MARISGAELAEKLGCSDTHVRAVLTKNTKLNPQKERHSRSPTGFKWMFDDNEEEIEAIRRTFVSRPKPVHGRVGFIQFDEKGDPALARIRERDLWTQEEAGKVLGLHPTTINKRIHSMHLKTLSNGKHQLIPAESLTTLYMEIRKKSKPVEAPQATSAASNDGHANYLMLSRRLNVMEDMINHRFQEIRDKLDTLLQLWS